MRFILVFIFIFINLPAQAQFRSLPGSPYGRILTLGFSEGAGTATADKTGRGNNGLLTNVASWNASGHTGGAVFNFAAGRRVMVAHRTSHNVTNQLTVMMWVYPTADPGSGEVTVFSKSNSGNSNACYTLMAWDYSAATGQPNLILTIGGTWRYMPATAKLALGVWTHLAATYDGAYMRIYVNGTLNASVAQTGNIDACTNGLLGIGYSPTWGEFFNAGRIDDVKMHNRALSAAQIVEEMNVPVP